MIHRLTGVLLCLAVVSITGRATAQYGFYIRTNLGFAVAPGLTIDGRDNDWGTRCDKLSNPGLAEARPGECAAAPPLSQFAHEVGRGDGMESAVAVGYGWNSLRFEVEYRYRTTTYGREEGEAQIIHEVTLEKQQ